ncbi:HD family hydrolase [Rhodoblastus acidophilus]|uniref:HD family hydrolase n=1 Tax=Candidatus Rhodoblastus alkanivorans TaxID=2954117 RepID=A0ABS9Z2Y7_9HYPH|nr:HD family hydrolase [Candidatus Rhodoblastus alkanivorans]MCI4677472.1 HD family hydrolase [Candidatus Rhodoblastus alkanivorans]MCI4681831.1 HD family hydrolase [Candidatus Rhodoblastus alkanivorans]MDI4642881.1 HD family hydrolase [Rhodoblastus acidophilus]
MKATAAPRAWQRMLSGRRLDILNPSPLDVEIEDIAHGLARVARWNGQTRGGVIFSVAQHSVLVAEICARLDPAAPARWRLHALLHDAPEYVIGDMISPFKAALGAVYTEVEARLARAILQRFSLSPDPPPALARLTKRADRISAFFEATLYAGFETDEAKRLFGAPAVDPRLFDDLLAPMGSEEAQALFLERFKAFERAS